MENLNLKFSWEKFMRAQMTTIVQHWLFTPKFPIIKKLYMVSARFHLIQMSAGQHTMKSPLYIRECWQNWANPSIFAFLNGSTDGPFPEQFRKTIVTQGISYQLVGFFCSLFPFQSATSSYKM